MPYEMRIHKAYGYWSSEWLITSLYSIVNSRRKGMNPQKKDPPLTLPSLRPTQFNSVLNKL